MPRKKSKQSVPEFTHTQPVLGDLRSDDPETLLRTHKRLQDAVEIILNEAPGGPVLLDLSDCNEIDPGGLLLTMYAVGQLLEREDLTLWYQSRGAVREYIRENLDHFWEAPSKRGKGSADEFLLRQIESRGAMVEDLNAYASGLRKASLGTDREVAIWETQVGELSTNSFQHGAALEDEPDTSVPAISMVAGRAYKEKSRVEMGVLDFGASIPRVIEKVAPEETKRGDGRLIAHALKRGVTSKTVPENQGSGLFGVVNAVKENDGRLLLLSGNGLACVKNGRISSRNLKSFQRQPALQGTLAIIVLNLH